MSPLFVQVLSTVKPVTRFIPITYDTVKRVSVIGLCTFSGVIQGRKAGGFFRRFESNCFFPRTNLFKIIHISHI